MPLAAFGVVSVRPMMDRCDAAANAADAAGCFALSRFFFEDMMHWSARFRQPISLPDGDTICTLDEARTFLNTLRSHEANALEWQVAAAAVLMVGKTGGSTDIARAALVEALIRSGRISEPRVEAVDPPRDSSVY